MTTNERPTPMVDAVDKRIGDDEVITWPESYFAMKETARRFERMCAKFEEAANYVSHHWPNMMTNNALVDWIKLTRELKGE